MAARLGAWWEGTDWGPVISGEGRPEGAEGVRAEPGWTSSPRASMT